MTALYLAALAVGVLLFVADLAGVGRRSSDSPDLSVWLPLASMRFWSVFLFAGGAVGAMLSAQGVAAAWIVAAISVVLGWVVGVVAVAVARAIHGTALDPDAPQSLLGAVGTVVDAIPEGGLGKVRFQSDGSNLELPAEGEYSAAVANGAEVTVVGRGRDGRVLVRG
jgi:hypothetical protein